MSTSDKTPHQDALAELAKRKETALDMGGPDKLAKRKASGAWNARERLDHLLDQDSFVESGLFATSHRPEVANRTPADGKVAGFGKVDDRPVAIVSNDFTVLGASSSVINGKKIGRGYITLDFKYEEVIDGAWRTVFEDYKAVDTRESRVRRQVCEAIHDIHIKLTRG